METNLKGADGSDLDIRIARVCAPARLRMIRARFSQKSWLKRNTKYENARLERGVRHIASPRKSRKRDQLGVDALRWCGIEYPYGQEREAGLGSRVSDCSRDAHTEGGPHLTTSEDHQKGRRTRFLCTMSRPPYRFREGQRQSGGSSYPFGQTSSRGNDQALALSSDGKKERVRTYQKSCRSVRNCVALHGAARSRFARRSAQAHHKSLHRLR